MSYPFECGDRTVWDAGFHSGQLYASMAMGAAGLLKVPSGLADTPAGSCEIDAPVFLAFSECLYTHHHSTNSDVLRGLLRPLLAVSLVLVERTGGTVVLRPEDRATLGQEMRVLARSMAHG